MIILCVLVTGITVMAVVMRVVSTLFIIHESVRKFALL